LELLAPALDVPASGDRTVVHVDATLGFGGHAQAVLHTFPQVFVVGLDRDGSAVQAAHQRLADYADRTVLTRAVYDELPAVLDQQGIAEVDGMVFDLGASSVQLDEVARGFSYSRDAPLDMRMDQSQTLTAEEVVNSYDGRALTRMVRAYGEERFAAAIAAAIVRERRRSRITSTARLAELVRAAIPAPARRSGGHPAKRTFQALRIEVNNELEVLREALPAAIDRLRVGGRIVVLSYHSLEDRITKHALAQRARSGGLLGLPVELPAAKPQLRLLTRGARLADPDEVAANPRAASLRLRAAERIRRPGGLDPTTEGGGP
jgi:16S rRNA (cytosine1402-N4)-methyltransferase